MSALKQRVMYLNDGRFEDWEVLSEELEDFLLRLRVEVETDLCGGKHGQPRDGVAEVSVAGDWFIPTSAILEVDDPSRVFGCAIIECELRKIVKSKTRHVAQYAIKRI